MRINRTLKRASQKKTMKQTEKILRKVEKAVNEMPNVCVKCTKQMDKTDKSQLNSWRVKVCDQKVELYCEKCCLEEIKDCDVDQSTVS